MNINGFEIDGRKRMRRQDAALCVDIMTENIRKMLRIIQSREDEQKQKAKKILYESRLRLSVLEQIKVTKEW